MENFSRARVKCSLDHKMWGVWITLAFRNVLCSLNLNSTKLLFGVKLPIQTLRACLAQVKEWGNPSWMRKDEEISHPLPKFMCMWFSHSLFGWMKKYFKGIPHPILKVVGEKCAIITFYEGGWIWRSMRPLIHCPNSCACDSIISCLVRWKKISKESPIPCLGSGRKIFHHYFFLGMMDLKTHETPHPLPKSVCIWFPHPLLGWIRKYFKGIHHPIFG